MCAIKLHSIQYTMQQCFIHFIYNKRGEINIKQIQPTKLIEIIMEYFNYPKSMIDYDFLINYPNMCAMWRLAGGY